MFKSFSQVSLVTKLMFLYTIATLALLIALGFSLYPTFKVLLSQYTAQDISYVTMECYKRFILTFLFGGVGALIVGNWVAKKGLNKIHELQERMELISVNSLDDRINLSEWPKELKALGSCYNEMLNRLQSAFIQLSQFSSDLAHELRHPIHNLKQITELKLSHPMEDASLQPLFAEYMQELDHLSKLIEQLLFLAKSENSQIILNKIPRSIQAQIQKLFDFYMPLAEEKQVRLHCEGDAQLLIDPTLFQRLLHNILSNAIKYSVEQGSVFIKIESTLEQQVHIMIQDTGIGIDASHLPKLYDRLYRVDSARTDNQGLGLGLAIAKSIVDLHQGSIEITSQLNQGTCVHLRFPASHEARV